MKNTSILLIITIALLSSCKQDSQWKGQEPIKKVDTHTVPIQKQHKGIFDIGSGIFCSNDFDCARLNGAVLTNDTLITVLITPENTPINKSPWYAFKVWATKEKSVYLKITYLDGYKHRYYPKLSYDGFYWQVLDSVNYSAVIDSVDNERLFPTNITMKLKIGPDTTWIAAQEIITSKDVYNWIDDISTNEFVELTTVGESHELRPIKMLKIGNADDKKLVIVLSRQHPPEVTGYMAMQTFVQAVCGDTEIAKKFRSEYNMYVVPMINPDGIDNGHWRHNSGGVDLNRDWEDFNQPETNAIRAFMKDKIAGGSMFYFAVDFHSTWEDIYYTVDPELSGNMPGLVPAMIEAMSQKLENYQPNIRTAPSNNLRITSDNHLFHEYGAEALTFEIGDNTPRDFLKKKGEVAAMELMKLMLDPKRIHQ